MTQNRTMYRKEKFLESEIYHIWNKSISNFGIFTYPSNINRFIETLDFYNNVKSERKFSNALRYKKYTFQSLISEKSNCLIKFLGYYISPDHSNLLVNLLRSNFHSKYIGTVENSYTRYFDLKSSRRGPLWQSEFKCVLIQSNEQLLHVSRYIHLNPVTNYLVNKPEDWEYSSYNDYMNKNILKKYLTEISIKSPKLYKKFVDNQINYQRKLKMIKKLILE